MNEHIQAVGAPIERQVRPRAWLVEDRSANAPRTYFPVLDEEDARQLAPDDAPPIELYDKAALEFAVAVARERMIADGWRQTKYVAPVTDCEACLTPDACAIRGQCGHYLRERD